MLKFSFSTGFMSAAKFQTYYVFCYYTNAALYTNGEVVTAYVSWKASKALHCPTTTQAALVLHGLVRLVFHGGRHCQFSQVAISGRISNFEKVDKPLIQFIQLYMLGTEYASPIPTALRSQLLTLYSRNSLPQRWILLRVYNLSQMSCVSGVRIHILVNLTSIHLGYWPNITGSFNSLLTLEISDCWYVSVVLYSTLLSGWIYLTPVIYNASIF